MKNTYTVVVRNIGYWLDEYEVEAENETEARNNYFEGEHLNPGKQHMDAQDFYVEEISLTGGLEEDEEY